VCGDECGEFYGYGKGDERGDGGTVGDEGGMREEMEGRGGDDGGMRQEEGVREWGGMGEWMRDWKWEVGGTGRRAWGG